MVVVGARHAKSRRNAPPELHGRTLRKFDLMNLDKFAPAASPLWHAAGVNVQDWTVCIRTDLNRPIFALSDADAQDSRIWLAESQVLFHLQCSSANAIDGRTTAADRVLILTPDTDGRPSRMPDGQISWAMNEIS